MLKRNTVGAILWIFVCAGPISAQTLAKVDFRRDVQPIFKANCIACHGPSQQMNGFRLDRRRDAMRGGTIAVIGPGNSAGSRLYMRLIGSDYGIQMPPTGPLSAEKINTIKTWIDQGADWPDDVAGDVPPTLPDPKAAQIMEALRNRDSRTFTEMLGKFPNAVNLKGPGGSTPLMYAALYGDADAVRRLLKGGADPNLHNDAGATAIMWAVSDLEKTQLLLKAGANVNARSDDKRSALLIAAGRYGSGPVVKLLLDHGADVSVKAPSGGGDATPLSEAAYAGDEAVLQMLIERGTDVKSTALVALSFAVVPDCPKCINRLAKSADRDDLNKAALFSCPPFGDLRSPKLLLDYGVDVKTKDSEGRTLLMLAASSDAVPLDAVKTLIARGADVNAKSSKGDTALDFARRHGKTSVVDALIQAGAKEGNPPADRAVKPLPAASIRAAIERSLPLLQRTDVSFIQKSGCVSCHNNTLTAMTVATARKNGLPVDDRIARSQLKTIASYIENWRERVLQAIGIPGDSDTVSYILVGMAAENYPPDAATDAMARYLKDHQSPDGRWWIVAHRPPLESSDIEVTAASMRAIQIYAPKANRPQYRRAVQLAAGWLAKARPRTNEDRAFQLLGLTWAGANKEIVLRAARELLSEQRPDGGWAQLPSLASDAYATGQALVALKEAGALAAADPAYKRGTEFLLSTQLEDGSWYVKTRALPIQPFFESGFPHGHDQWISAAATNWATMALALAAQPQRTADQARN